MIKKTGCLLIVMLLTFCVQAQDSKENKDPKIPIQAGLLIGVDNSNLTGSQVDFKQSSGSNL